MHRVRRPHRGRQGKLIEAARWVHACNQIAAAEADPVEGPKARDWRRPCPQGPHEPLADCEACGGCGSVSDDPRELAEAPPWLAACAGFLEIWSGIQTHGAQGWAWLTGAEPAPDLAEALSVFDGELNRLRHEDDVARARKARADLNRRS